MSYYLTRTVSPSAIPYSLLEADRLSRLLRRQFDKGNIRNQWRIDADTSRRKDWRQCQAILRGHTQVRKRQGETRSDQSPYIQVRFRSRMAAGCLQPRSHARFTFGVRLNPPLSLPPLQKLDSILMAFQWTFPAKNTPWSRCQIPRHGHHIRPHAAPGRAGRD